MQLHEHNNHECEIPTSPHDTFRLRNPLHLMNNVDADALSAKSIDFGPGIHLFETAPDFLKDILYADAMGVSRHRLVAA
ncbi:hypothetical protein L3X38_016727 [Prunus dulcis]|uniref:Uncharacterized protein n=1 Tax=Prunus dulcis TaxID=3755 RepID=A0AAD4W8D5_PRUDU|nr:hypothetical protein L3X38_016727 [Prunus dulcis]